ncbi:MAG: redoxin domain-containing protein [Limisphaerales bacterium]
MDGRPLPFPLPPGLRAAWLGCLALGVGASMAFALEPDPSRAVHPTSPCGEDVRKLTVSDLEGRSRSPLDLGAEDFGVFVFLSNDCPVANRYAPEIRRIAGKFEGKRVRFWMVHPLESETLESIRAHAKEYELPGTVVHDPGGTLARCLGITVTPEVAVVDRQTTILYRGRIDDRYPALGQQRRRPTRRDLVEALSAVLAGEPVDAPRTKAVGCSLPVNPPAAAAEARP